MATPPKTPRGEQAAVPECAPSDDPSGGTMMLLVAIGALIPTTAFLIGMMISSGPIAMVPLAALFFGMTLSMRNTVFRDSPSLASSSKKRSAKRNVIAGLSFYAALATYIFASGMLVAGAAGGRGAVFCGLFWSALAYGSSTD